MLSKTYKRKKNAHRVEEYVDLLAQFLGKEIPAPPVTLTSTVPAKSDSLIININSEASSRRLPKEKAVSIINKIRMAIKNEIILVGSQKEKPFVDEVYELLSDRTGIK